MIGIWGSHAAAFLQLSAVATLLAFALPIFLMPLSWAGWFGWRLPEDPDLARYFGRCLGGIACVLGGASLYVAGEPALQAPFMGLLVGVYLTLVWVHIVGALQQVQPFTETIEIAFWMVLILLTLCFFPVATQAV